MPTISANDAELFYELSGPSSAPVVTFSNALGATLDMWEAQVAALRGRYRCLRYDTRNHGRSGPSPEEPIIDALADDLHALLDALGIGRTHVVGISLGGMIAQAFAGGFPDRLASLVLIATPAIADTHPRARLSAIAAPTLIIAGADDPATPLAMAEELRQRIAGAEMIVVPRAAHLLAVEHAEVVNSYLAAFLDRHRCATELGAADFAAGLANRKAVLGAEHVEKSLHAAGAFAMPWQDFITRYAWGEIWGDPALPWKTRSLVTLALMAALHREEEFKLHVRPALGNGVTEEELRALLRQCAVYAGVPAANAAFRWVRDIFGEELA